MIIPVPVELVTLILSILFLFPVEDIVPFGAVLLLKLVLLMFELLPLIITPAPESSTPLLVKLELSITALFPFKETPAPLDASFSLKLDWEITVLLASDRIPAPSTAPLSVKLDWLTVALSPDISTPAPLLALLLVKVEEVILVLFPVDATPAPEPDAQLPVKLQFWIVKSLPVLYIPAPLPSNAILSLKVTFSTSPLSPVHKIAPPLPVVRALIKFKLEILTSSAEILKILDFKSPSIVCPLPLITILLLILITLLPVANLISFCKLITPVDSSIKFCKNAKSR